MTGRWFGLICLAVMYIFAYFAFPYVQSPVPLHSNDEALVDLWATPFEAVIFPPILASLLYLIQLVHRQSQTTNRHDLYIEHLAWLLMNLAIVILCVIYLAVLCRYFGWLSEVRRAVLLASGLGFISIGYYLPRTKREEWIGLRTPWTLASQTVWDSTHRFGQWTFLFGGVIIAASAWFSKSDRRAISMIGFLVATVLPAIYSYIAWRREAQPRPPS